MTFLIILGVTEILCSFKLGQEGKTGKEMPESSRLELLEKFLLVYVSLVASRTLFQRSLACLDITLKSEHLSFW